MRRDKWGVLSFLSSHKGHGKALSVSVLNQIVSSGTNFILGIYLVRVLMPADFGLYGIGFAISLFYYGIGYALFLSQMVVHNPDKAPDERPFYAARMLVLTGLFCTASVLLAGLAFLGGGHLWAPIADFTPFGLAIAAASVAYLLKDFFIRYAYNLRKESWALAINGVLALILAVMLWGEHHVSHKLSVEIAIWIYALAHASAAVYGCFLTRLRFQGITKSALVLDAVEAWQGGRWASITNLMYFLRIHAHTVIVATLIGPLGVAKLNAARLLVTPAVMLTPALAQVAMPRLASVRAESPHKVIKFGLGISIGLLTVAILYCVILLSIYDWIVPQILGDKYSDLFFIALLWCGYVCLLAIRAGTEICCQVLKKFKQLTVANSVSAITSLVAVYLLTVEYGLNGALVGLTIGEVVLIAYSSLIVRMYMGSDRNLVK